MTSTPTAPRFSFQIKAGRAEFDENEHPRDRKGRFIETGAEVRIWGGQTGTVLRNVGGGKIEVERADGRKVIVHRNYLTVQARPNGEAPTVDEAEAEAVPVEEASPDAEEDPALAEGDDVALPDRGDAPDQLADTEGLSIGDEVGAYRVGEWVDGPSAIDGWVVDVTDAGGPIVRTEEGVDWPLLPDAEMVRDAEGAPEPPADLLGAPTVDPATADPADLDDEQIAVERGRVNAAIERERDRLIGEGWEDGQPAPTLDELDDRAAALRQEAYDRQGINPEVVDEGPDLAPRPIRNRGQEAAPAAPAAPAAEAAPEGDVIDSLNPSSSGVFEDYESGREFRATAPLADNMTTLAETEGVDPDETVTVYRGVPEDAPEGLQPGDFITTNRQLAEDYAGGGRIEETEVRYGDILDDLDEPGGEEYIYRPQAEGATSGPDPRTADPADLDDEAIAVERGRLLREYEAERNRLIGEGWEDGQPAPTLDALQDREWALADEAYRRVGINPARVDEGPNDAPRAIRNRGNTGPDEEALEAARSAARSDYNGAQPDPERSEAQRALYQPGNEAYNRALDAAYNEAYEQTLLEAAEEDEQAAPAAAEGDLLPRGQRGSTDGEVVISDDVQPGDVLNTIPYGDVRISERRTVAGRTGRTSGGSGNSPDTEALVGVDSQGLIRVLPSMTGRERRRRVAQGEVQPLPERTTERVKPDAIQPGDRIMMPSGEAIVVRAQREVGDTGRQTDLWLDTRTGDVRPVATRFRDNQNIERTGSGEAFDPRHEQVLAAADAEYATDPTSLYYRDVVNGIDPSTLPEAPAAPEAPEVDEDDAPAPRPDDTESRVQQARDAGYRAYMDNEMRAPFMSETVRGLLDPDAAVGDPANNRIMHAFTEGFDQAGDDDLNGRLTPPDLPEDEEDLPEGAIGAAPSRGRETTITLPDGTTAKRTSKSREYTHVVVSQPATPEARAAAYNRQADALEASAAKVEAAIEAGRVVKRNRRLGSAQADDPDYFHGYEAELVGTEEDYSRGRGGRSAGQYRTVTTRSNINGETQVYGDVPEGVEVIREVDGQPVVRARAYLLATARREVERARQQAAALREEGQKPDSGYNVLRWTSSPELGRRAASGELAYESERYGRTLAVLPVDSADGETRPPRGGGDQQPPAPAPVDEYADVRGQIVDVSGRPNPQEMSEEEVRAEADDLEQRLEAISTTIFGYDGENEGARALPPEHAEMRRRYTDLRHEVGRIDRATQTGPGREMGDAFAEAEERARTLPEGEFEQAERENRRWADANRNTFGVERARFNGFNSGAAARRENGGAPLPAREWRARGEEQPPEPDATERPDPTVVEAPGGPRYGRRPSDLRPGDRVHTQGGSLLRERLVGAEATASAAPGGGIMYPFGNQVRTIDRIEGDTIYFVTDENFGGQQRTASIEEFRGQRDALGRSNPDRHVLVEQDEEATPPPAPAPGPDPDPDVQPGVPRLANPRAAADYIVAQIGDPDMRDNVQAALNPQTRAVNGIYGADGMRAVERHPDAERLLPLVLTARAGIGHRNGRRVWDGEAAQAALVRYHSGDPTLPANSVGRRASIEVLDMDAPIRLGQPATMKRVEGTVDSVSEATSPGLYLRIIDDSGEPHVQAMRPDATVDLVEAPAPAPTPSGGDHPAEAIANGNPEPITLRYVRNPNSSTTSGADQNAFGQDVEPAGRYLSAASGDFVPEGWQSGTVAFQKPLHMDWGPMSEGYDSEQNWKRRLSAHYGGLTGQALADAVRADGYDAIMTNDAYGDSEIVDLSNGAAEVTGPDADPGNANRLAPGTRVTARQPGIEQSVEGELVDYDSNGMARVRYFNRRGEAVVGTFNPNYVEAVVITPRSYEGPNGTLTEGMVIARELRGDVVLNRLVSIGDQSVGLRATDNHVDSHPITANIGLDRILGGYRPATPEEVERYERLTGSGVDRGPDPTPVVGPDGDVDLTSLITPLPDMLAEMDEYETNESLAYAIRGIDDNIVTLSGDEYSQALRYRARLVAEQQRRNAERGPDPEPLPDVTTSAVRAGDLSVGDRFAFEGGIGTVTNIEPDGNGLAIDYVDTDGNPGTYFSDADATFAKVDVDSTAVIPPVPDENPPATVERTAQVSGQNLVPGDRVWLGRDKVEVTAVEPNGPDLMAVTVRWPDRRTETMPFGREAVLDRADDPFLPEPSPLDAETRTSRPVLYTYQRRNIVALGLDTDTDPLVAEAARRIRTRKPLAAAHSAALAQRLADMSAAPGVKPQRQRMLLRLAAANNAASIEAGGRGVDLPDMPNADRVTKTRPGDVGVGDQIAFVGLRGAIEQGRITNARRMMSGRLTEVTYETPDGTERTVMLTRNTDVYVMPDLPEPTPVPQRSDAAPELVEYGSLRVGDRIRIPNTTDLFDDERTLTEATVVEAGQSEGLAYAVLNVHDVMSNDSEQRMVLSIDPRMQGLPPVVIRVERGAESADQPREHNLPALDPQEVALDDVAVGDWIATNNRNVGTSDGIVVAIEPIMGEDGQQIGSRMQLRRPGGHFGSASWVTAMNDGTTSVTRLIAGDTNTVLRIAEEKRRRTRVAREQAAARDIDRVLSDYNSAMHFRVVQNALHGGSISDEHYTDAVWNAFTGGGDPTTNLDDDRLRAVGKMTTTLQGHLSGESAGEAGFNGVREAAAQLAEKMVNDHHFRIQTALFNVQPTQPGETKATAGIALARSVLNPDNWGAPAMEQRDLGALARGIVEAREAREAASLGDDGAPDRSVPDLPEGASLRDRIAAYKSRLPGRFGFMEKSVTTFGEFDLDSLERGEVPELTTAVARVKDKATDGGPGADAMAQLELLRAAGADLAAAIDRRMETDYPDLTTAARDALYNERHAAEKRYDELASARNEEYTRAKDRRARELGFVNANAVQQMAYRRQDPPEGMSYDDVMAAYRQVQDVRNSDETFRAADNASNEAYQQFKTLNEHFKAMTTRIAEARAKAARDVLSEVRGMGGTQLAYNSAGRSNYETTKNPLRNGETMKAMRYAETNYPTEWLDTLSRSPKGPLSIGATKRGFFQGGAWIIRLSKDDNRNNESGWVPPRGRVATHELGHAMETVIPGLSQAEEAFLWSRTSNGEIGQRERGRSKRIDSSRSYTDEFPESYSGKDYADGTHYELFTTGMESLFAGSPYLDDDMRNWVLGTLALL